MLNTDDVPRGRARAMLGPLQLFAAAVLWGIAFIPQKHSVEVLPPLTATAVRFVLAAPVALLCTVLAARWRGERVRLPGGSARGLGLILFLAYATQTAALVYAPLTRVSLITGMYAVFVPLFAPLFGHDRPKHLHWAGAAVAFAGLLALVGIVGDSQALSVPLNVGDLLVLIHAILGAVHVLLVGRLVRDAEPFALNFIQVAAVALVSVPAAILVDGPEAGAAALHLSTSSMLAFAYLAVISTVVAFTCQISGQRTTSPATAAVIMLLESPVALVAAVVVLHERMGVAQWMGAVVLLLGVALSLIPELKSHSSRPTT